MTLKKLFTKEWHDSKSHIIIMETIKETLNDYFVTEIKGHLIDTYFRKFAVECLDRLVEQIVIELLTKKNSLTKETSARLLEDITVLQQFFIAHEILPKVVKKHLKVLHILKDLISFSSERLPEKIQELKEHSPDVSIAVIKTILSMRDNINKKDLRALIDKVTPMLEATPPTPLTTPTANEVGETNAITPLPIAEGLFSKIESVYQLRHSL